MRTGGRKVRGPGGGLVYSPPLRGWPQATLEQGNDPARMTRRGLTATLAAPGEAVKRIPAEDTTMTTVATASAVRVMPAERTGQLVWWLAALFKRPASHQTSWP